MSVKGCPQNAHTYFCHIHCICITLSLLGIGLAITFGKKFVKGPAFDFYGLFAVLLSLCMLFFVVIKIDITDHCAAIYHLPSHLRKSWTEDITIQTKATSDRSNRGY